jgi:hypothetical protein
MYHPVHATMHTTQFSSRSTTNGSTIVWFCASTRTKFSTTRVPRVLLATAVYRGTAMCCTKFRSTEVYAGTGTKFRSTFVCYCAFAQKRWVVLKKASAPPLFLEDENFFQKLASVVPWGIEFSMVPRRLIFAKCSHLREKGVVLIFFRSRIDQHIKDEPCANQRALLGVSSSRFSSVSRGVRSAQKWAKYCSIFTIIKTY